jgi:hypothetical protein
VGSGLTLDTNLALRGAAAGDLRFDGAVGGAGGLRVNLDNALASVSLRGGGNAFTGSVAVNRGALVLTGSGGIATAGPLSVGHQGAVLIDNSQTNNGDRLGDTAAVTLGGGSVSLFGNPAQASTETAGALTLASGQSLIDVRPGAAAGARLTFASLSSSGSGGVLFNGTANGLGSAPGSGVANVLFTTAPALVGGNGADGSTTVSILPQGLATGGPTLDGVTLVTYGPNGVRALAASEFATSLTTGAAADNVRITSSNASVTAPTTRNSLVLAADGQFLTIGSGATLNLTSGAFVNLGGGSLVTGSGTLAFGGRAYLTVEGRGRQLTLETPISVAGNAGLVKSGTGNLLLENTATLGSNSVFVNAGTLKVVAATPLASSPGVRVSHGATLDVTLLAAGLPLGSGQTLSGDGTVSGALRVGNGARVDPTGGSGTGPATLTVGNTTLQPGGTYVWRLNSVEGGAFNQSLLGSAGSLDLSGLSNTNRFTIRLTSLTAENAAGAVPDFNNGTGYNWTLATYAGGITNFSADKFTINTDDFANGLGNGTFTIGKNGNSLVISFVPVPEPPLLLGMAAAGLAGGAWLRRRSVPRGEGLCGR